MESRSALTYLERGRVFQIVTLAALGIVAGRVVFIFNGKFRGDLAIGAFTATVAAATFVAFRRRDYVFSVFFVVLFVYVIFAQITYLFFADTLIASTSGLYRGSEAFPRFFAFVFGSFVLIWIIRQIVISHRGPNLCMVDYPSSGRHDFRRGIALLVFTTQTVVLGVYLLGNWTSLSYVDALTASTSPIVAVAQSFSVVSLPTLWFARRHTLRTSTRNALGVLLASQVVIAVMMSAALGDRSIVVPLGIGLAAGAIFVPHERRGQRPVKTLRRLAFVVATVIVVLGASSALRTTRGSDRTTVAEVVASPFNSDAISGEFLSAQALSTQDYSTPALTLLVSMDEHLVAPAATTISNLRVAAIGVDAVSLGEQVSRVADPSGTQGYGYYILTEGYNVLGTAGILYNALVFNVIVGALTVLTRSNWQPLRRLGMILVCSFAILIVRDQSAVAFKQILIFIGPGLVMLCWLCGRRMRIARVVSEASVWHG